MNILTPPIAFLFYLLLVAILTGVGRMLAGAVKPNGAKTETYGSGESGPTAAAAPGYRPFFTIALFFAVLHLGILMLASSGLTPISGLYLLGLGLALLALILG
ncbi:MAG: hypothetical protein IPL78_18650 [Chloroflexi bacterium]|nr:hypothetical protein [Chloroflexota bacterium]